MKTKNNPLSLLAILLFVILSLIMGPQFLHASEPAQDELTAVWQRVRQSGAYSFNSELRQTLTPLPTAVNAGRQPKETAVYMQGQTDIAADALHLTIWSGGGSAAIPESGVEFKVENGRTFTRQGSGPWQKSEDVTSLVAPNGDMLAYLEAADNVIRHEPELRSTPVGNFLLTRYTFDVNGRRFATYMQSQMQAQDGLPPGMKVQLPQIYLDMTGTGELWVGQDGLPLRQQFELHFPDRADDYSQTVAVTVDFTDFEPLTAVSSTTAFTNRVGNALQSKLTPRALMPLPATLALFLVLALLMKRRQTKRIYTPVVLTIIASMLFSPLFSSMHVAAYSSTQIAKQARQEAQQAEQESLAALQAELLTPNFDPRADPLQQLQNLKTDTAVANTTTTSDTSKYFDSSCTTDPDADMDGDGLTNLEECLLGTLPGTADTDGDLLDDGVEVAGIIITAQDGTSSTWYTDPLNLDSNYDSLSDGHEWLFDQNGDTIPDDTDADGTPDIWDQDNDGDGVPDDLDLSPYSNTKDSNIYSGDNPMQLIVDDLQSGELVKVEFQFSPTNSDHLWYSNNVLDWPDGDLQGQLQDQDGKTFFDLDNTLSPSPNDNGDMRLIPMLEIEITGANDNLPSQDILNQFGISIVQTSNNTQKAYVPAQLVIDRNGDKNVAFYGAMFYRAGSSWGNAQAVRLVWLVQALVDKCDAFENNVCTSYSVLNDVEIVQTYADEWFLTGLHVTEEHSAKIDIILEDPIATATVDPDYDKPYYMDTLYGLLYGLDSTFLAGSDCDTIDGTGDCVGNDERDITVDEITRRFDHNTNNGVSEEERWNLPNVLSVQQKNYDSIDLGIADTTVTQTINLLDANFTSAWSAAQPITPTIMYAYEQTFRSLNLDQSIGSNPNFDLTGNGMTIDLPQGGTNAVALNTMTSVKWSPYAYDPIAGWETADIQTYYDDLTANLGSSFTDIDDPDEAETYQTMAQQIYVTVYSGENNIVQVNDQITSQAYQQADSSIGAELAVGARSLIKSATSAYYSYSPELKAIAATLRAEGQEATTAAKLSRFMSQQWAKYTQDAEGIGKLTLVGLFAVVAAVGLFALYILHDTSTAWEITAAVGVGGVLTLLSIIKPLLKVVSLVSEAETTSAGLTKLFASAEAINRVPAAAIIGLIITALIAIGIFVYVWASGKVSAGTIAFNELIAYTIASIIVAVILFIIGLTVIGSILVAIIAVIDIILTLLGVGWSITGWLTEAIAGLIYQYKLFEKIDVQAGELSTDLVNPAKGMIAGNSMAYSLPMTTTLTSTSDVGRGIIDNSLIYQLSQNKEKLSTNIGDRRMEWGLSGDNGPIKATIYETVILSSTLVAGVNLPTALNLNSAYALRGQSCWLGFCTSKNIKGSSSDDLGVAIIFDILPATLDEFVATTWSNGEVAFKDADGDGLLPFSEGGIDPDETTWDADGDNLGDAYELTISAKTSAEGGANLDPLLADTDGDTLPDDEEFLLGTNPDNADSDGDGLNDVAEVAPYGGWFLAYAPGKFTRVWSSPLADDFDGDGMSDLFERTQDTCPECEPWADSDNPLVYSPNVWNESPVALYVSDDSNNGFVAPDASLVYTTTTANNLSSGQSLVGNISLDPPVPFPGGPLSAGIDVASGGEASLVTLLTANSSQSAPFIFGSTMNLTDIEATAWSWDPAQTINANAQIGKAANPAIAAPIGWSEPFVLALREITTDGTQLRKLTAYTASADGTLHDKSVLLSYPPAYEFTAPAVTCDDSGICLLVVGVNLSISGNDAGVIVAVRLHNGLTNPSSFNIWPVEGIVESVAAPAVATNGSDFMLTWSAQTNNNNQLWVQAVNNDGSLAGSAKSLAGPAANLTNTTIDWDGFDYVAVWSDGTNLRRADVSTTGVISGNKIIGAGSGWPNTDGSESAPAIAFDAISQQALLLYRAENGGSAQLQARRLNAVGASPEFVLETDPLLNQEGVQTALCADPQNGGWVAAWSLPGQALVSYHAIGPDGSMRGITEQVASAADADIALACSTPLPELYLEFEEGAGATSFADSSGNGHAATCQGSQCPLAGVEGRFGNGILFDGVDDLLSNPIAQNNKTFTSELWARTNSQSGTILARESGHKKIYFSNGNICAKVNVDSGANVEEDEICSSGVNYGDGIWHHIVHVGNKNTHSLYVDGVLAQKSGTIAMTPCNNCTAFNLGDNGGYGGSLDSVRFHNRALSGAEVQDVFEAAVAIYDLDEVAGSTTFVDSSNNGFNASCSGSSCPTTGVPGVAYTAVQFDGVDDFLTVNPAQKVDELFQYDFETAVPPEWSITQTDVGVREGNDTRFLGPVRNETINLNLSDLPPHDTLEISFDLFVLGDWGGNSTIGGPDNWEWGYGNQKILNTNFSNRSNANGWYQFFPAESWNLSGIKLYGNSSCTNNELIVTEDIPHLGDTPMGNNNVSCYKHPSDTVAYLYKDGNYGGNLFIVDPSRGLFPDIPNNDLSSVRVWSAANAPKHGASGDSLVVNGFPNSATIYRITKTISGHTANSLELYFKGLNPTDSQNYWGLDNVVVSVQSQGSSLPLTNSSFTLAMWAQRTAVNQGEILLAQGVRENNQGLHFGFRPNNNFTCAFWNDDLDTSQTYTSTDWHHWACTYDATTRQRTLYRDGVQVVQDTASANYSGFGATFIGKIFDDDWFYQGMLDEIGVWEQALSATEIAELAAKVKVVEETAMTAVLPTASGGSQITMNSLTLRETATTLGYDAQTITRTLTVDADAPSTSISVPQNGTIVRGQGRPLLQMSGQATDATSSISQVEVQVDGGSWQAATGAESWHFIVDLTNLAEGNHTLSARALDLLGNVGAATSTTFTLDSSPPTIQHQEPGLRPFRDAQGRWRVSLSGSVSDPNGVASVEILLEGAQELAGRGWQTAALSGNSWSLDYILPPFGTDGQSLADPSGPYAIFLRAADDVGNHTQDPAAAGTFVLDASAPVPSLTNPLTTTTLITTAMAFNGSVESNSNATAVEVNFTPAEQIDALSGSIMQLPFDENQFTEYFSDQSGANHAAVCNNNTCPSVNQNGRRDSAIAFDGVDDALEIASGDLLDFTTAQDFTVALWLTADTNQPDSSDSSNSIVSKWSGSGGFPYAIRYLHQSGKITAVRSDGSNTPTLTSTAVVNDGQFHHVAFIKSGATLALYIDGILDSTTTDNTSGSIGNNTAVFLGSRNGASNYFKGSMDEMMIYDRALAAYEVSNLVAYGFGIWQAADLNGTTWSYTLPEGSDGLENIYQLNVRATGSNGNVTPQSQQNLWRGEIDTRPPTLSFTATVDTTGSASTTTFTCLVNDINLDQDSSCLPVIPATVPTFRSGDLTTTNYDQVNPWYAVTITDTTRLYNIDAERTYSGTQDTNGSLQACDRFNRCTTEAAATAATEMTNTTTVNVVRLAAAPTADLAAEILDPSSGTVLTSLDAVTISGHAFAAASLQELIVTVEDTAVYNTNWPADTTTDTPWSFSWTPPAQGSYLFDAQVTDWDDAAATAVRPSTIIVDTEPPTVTITPTQVTTADLIGAQIVQLSGSANDSVAVHRVDIRINNGIWQPTGLSANGSWSYAWTLDSLIDGQTVNIEARATDLAGFTTTTSSDLLVDIVAPEPGTITLAYLDTDGQQHSLTTYDTVTDAADLQIQFGTGSDGSSIDHYEVGYTNSPDATADQLTSYPTASSHQQAAGQTATWYAHVRLIDGAGNSQTVTSGPIYIDAPLTPDLVSNPNYHEWTDAVCNIQDIDRRLAQTHPDTYGDAVQQFFTSWDTETLRLSWHGAHWGSNGDLFVYLDTRPGGSDRLYNPYPDDMIVYLPGNAPDPAPGATTQQLAATQSVKASSSQIAMQADYMVWVESDQLATLWRWDGAAWQNENQLDAQHFAVSGSGADSDSDILLPFDTLGILDPASAALGLVAVATDEDALRLWSTMPARNALNSLRVVKPYAAQMDDYTMALSRAFFWDGLGIGLCPNGRFNTDGSGPAGGAFSDSNLQLSLTADPVGTTFSFMQDDLAPWWTFLFGFENVPYVPSQFFDSYDTDHPPLGDGDVISYTIHYENSGSEAATGVQIDLNAAFNLDLTEQLIDLGDIPAGTSGSYTFNGTINAATQDEGTEEPTWAGLMAFVYDDRSPGNPEEGFWSSAPLEWLLSDHPIDAAGPDAIMITSPDSVIGIGAVTVRGTVYDQSAVPTITLQARVNGESVPNVHCPQTSPATPDWQCTWELEELADGDIVELHAQGTDVFEHDGVWSQWVSVVVDTTPPEVTVNPGIDGETLGAGNHTLHGTLSDNQQAATVQICNADETCNSTSVDAATGNWSIALPTSGSATPDGLQQTLDVYGIDAAGNRSPEPVTVTYWLDSVSPQLVVTTVVTEVGQETNEPILAGTASDGSAFTVYVNVTTPAGLTQRFKANVDDGSWSFNHVFETVGIYQLRVQAVDIAGNIITTEPYQITYTLQPQAELTLYLPLIAKQ